jgi:glycosyltransferase involved in cell wall biosynthesis
VTRSPSADRRVIVCAPDPGHVGGVASFWRALVGHVDHQLLVLTVGRRVPAEKGFATLRRLIGDYARFARAVASRDTAAVHLNPSLDWRSLFREAVFLMIAVLARKPAVVMVHGWDPTVEGVITRWLKRPFLLIFGRASSFIVLASAFRRTLSEWGYPGPVHVLSTVLEDDLVAAATRRMREEPRPSADGPELLHLGRIVREKGIDTCLEALRAIAESAPGAHLVVAGSGPGLDDVKAWTARHPSCRVSVVGEVRGPDRLRLLETADIMVFPSRYGEGMPTVVLEGLAFGLTPVVTPVGGVADLARAGAGVVTVPPSSPEAVSEAVLELLRDDPGRRDKGRRGHAFALQHFTADAVGRCLSSVYRAAIDGSPTEVTWYSHVSDAQPLIP